MSQGGQPLFVKPTTYRWRRRVDAARVLPVIGLGLLIIPLLWGTEGDAAVPMSRAVIYIFGVWAVLILAAGLLARGLRDQAVAEATATEKSSAPATDGARDNG